LAAAVESFTLAADEVHQAFSHDQVIDHHHHDAFTAQYESMVGEPAHHHASDNFQTSGLVPHFNFISVTTASKALTTLNPQDSPSVFLDGLLRPPRAFA